MSRVHHPMGDGHEGEPVHEEQIIEILREQEAGAKTAEVYLRRWVAKGIIRDFFLEWSGLPVHSVKTAFKSAVALANLPMAVTPHTLRHTAATWLMQAGVDK